MDGSSADVLAVVPVFVQEATMTANHIVVILLGVPHILFLNFLEYIVSEKCRINILNFDVLFLDKICLIEMDSWLLCALLRLFSL